MALFIPGHNITTSLHTSFSADLLPRAGIHPAVIQTLGSTVSGWLRHNDQLEHRHKLYDYFGAQKETHKAQYYARNSLEEPYLLITQGKISPVMTS